MAFGYIGRETAFTRPGGMQPFTRTFQTPAQVRVATAPVRAATASAAPAAGGINKTALAAIQRAKAYYKPGGGFGKGVEAGLERGRVKAMASGMQGLVSAGLAGTTMAGGLGKKFEEEVGAPTRLSVEEQRAQAISGIEMAQAGMGFQAGEAGLQRGFQAGQATQQRELQRYIADLQASLQREQIAAPTGRYARQFPAIYAEQTDDRGEMREPAPSLGGDEWERPDISFQEPIWGASEKWRSEQGFA